MLVIKVSHRVGPISESFGRNLKILRGANGHGLVTAAGLTSRANVP